MGIRKEKAIVASFKNNTRPRFRQSVAGIVLLSVFAFLGLERAPAATTHYIAANGSDSNDGMSKATPWLHLPGMRTCSSVCASYIPAAGDQFILRGGDSWTNANFPITWTWSGSSRSPIYIGVDHIWYSGGSWTRPVFNAGGVAVPGDRNHFIGFNSVIYVALDDIEMTGIYWSGAPTYGAVGAITTWGSDYVTLENLYIHNWTHAIGGGTTDDNVYMVIGQTYPPFCGHCLLANSIIQDADGGGNSGSATYAWGGSIKNCIFHDLPNAILEMDAGSAEISGNLIFNITVSFGGIHENAIESLGGSSGTLYIHDNVIHDVTAESMMLGNTGETDYVWNNVFYNLRNGLGPSFPQNRGQSGMSLYFWNNTIATSSVQNCFYWVSGFGGTFKTVAIQNTHCITTGGLYNTGPTATTLTVDHNVVQTPAAAAAQGYSAAQTYAYSPTPLANATLAVGTIMCGVELACNGPLGGLISDTTYACTQQTVKGDFQLVCPARTVVARPSHWDAGAYQHAPPAAPTGLAGVAR